jgi:Undecaprenyl-phosphate galactose phosphotransferase WbaP
VNASPTSALVFTESPRYDRWLGLRVAAQPLAWRRLTPVVAPASLVLIDLVVFLVAFGLASRVRDSLVGPMHQPVLIWVAAGAWLLARAWVGLYPGYGLAAPEELRTSIYTTLAVALGEVAAFFVLKESAASRLVVVGTWGLVVLLGGIARDGIKGLLIRCRLYGCPVIVVGAGTRGALAIREMKANPGTGYIPVAVFDNRVSKLGKFIEGVPVLGTVRTALSMPLPYTVRHVLIAVSPHRRRPRLLGIARRFSRRFAHVVAVPDVFELAHLWVRPRALGGCLTLEIRNNLLVPVNQLVKRFADLLLAVPILVLSAPVIAIAAIVVKLVSPGPAFYGQEREGRHGRRIRVWKLRTMVPDAERRLAVYLANHPEARLEWDTRMKLLKDPRVIPYVGRWLRRFSVDELPQFWNIVTGDMSLVGPRPFPDYHLVKFSAQFRAFRHQVRPGLSGMWQVSERSMADMAGQEARDSYYIRNWSLWLDLWILFRTLPATLRGTGAC